VKYNIITISDEREGYKTHIRKVVKIPEVVIPATDARKVNLVDELDKRGLPHPTPGLYSIGEIGIWLSVFDCWQWAADNNEVLVTFEDDAIPRPYFDDALESYLEEIPADWDFLCLWVPPNQRRDYLYDVTFDEHGNPDIKGYLTKSLFDFGGLDLARAYNGYGNGATAFSPKGAQHFIDRARESGLYSPVDCFLYIEAHTGRCNGYSPKPIHAHAVGYDWATTTVHTTERFT